MIIYTVKPVLRGQMWDKEKVTFYDRRPLKRGSIHMNFSMKGQENIDILMEVTAWAGFTVHDIRPDTCKAKPYLVYDISF
jgi:hypothetical protein